MGRLVGLDEIAAAGAARETKTADDAEEVEVFLLDLRAGAGETAMAAADGSSVLSSLRPFSSSASSADFI